jgi:hypothetical protein
MRSGTKNRKVVRAGPTRGQYRLRFLRLCHVRGFYLSKGAGASWHVYISIPRTPVAEPNRLENQCHTIHSKDGGLSQCELARVSRPKPGNPRSRTGSMRRPNDPIFQCHERNTIAIAALGADMARQGEGVRRGQTAHVRAQLDRFTRLLTNEHCSEPAQAHDHDARRNGWGADARPGCRRSCLVKRDPCGVARRLRRGATGGSE